jgi:ATP-binding cassette subfamily B protein
VWWLGVAAGVGLGARLTRTFQDYVLRLVVQKFGMQIFNDGLRQTLRLSFQVLRGALIQGGGNVPNIP